MFNILKFWIINQYDHHHQGCGQKATVLLIVNKECDKWKWAPPDWLITKGRKMKTSKKTCCVLLRPVQTSDSGHESKEFWADKLNINNNKLKRGVFKIINMKNIDFLKRKWSTPDWQITKRPIHAQLGPLVSSEVYISPQMNIKVFCSFSR